MTRATRASLLQLFLQILHPGLELFQLRLQLVAVLEALHARLPLRVIEPLAQVGEIADANPRTEVALDQRRHERLLGAPAHHFDARSIAVLLIAERGAEIPRRVDVFP